MPESSVPQIREDLGKLVAVHPIAPAFLQRAVFIVILSFLFFLGMMFAFYLRQNFIYFLLASAFLLVYLVTLFSWIMQRRVLVKIYEHGIGYKDRSVTWHEIDAVGDNGLLNTRTGKPIAIPASIYEREKIIELVRREVVGTGTNVDPAMS